jgi:hypothetical protein
VVLRTGSDLGYSLYSQVKMKNKNKRHTYCHISSERVEIDALRYDAIVHNRTLSRDQPQQ